MKSVLRGNSTRRSSGLWKCLLIATACLGGTLSSSAGAATVDSVLAAQQAKLEAAVQRLNQLRNQIQQEQLPLGRALQERKQEVEELRQQYQDLLAARDRDQTVLQSLEERLRNARREYEYISRTLFTEYSAAYQAHLSIGEKAQYGEEIRQLNLFAENESATEAEILQRSLNLIRSSLQRTKSLIGGKIYPGEALDSAGRMQRGKFVQVGPLLYFAAEGKGDSGLVRENLGLRPQVQAIGSNNEALVVNVAETGEGLLPVDPTLQNALLIAETKEGFMEHLEKGGVWVIPIVAFAVLATLAALAKMVQIFSIRSPEPTVAHDLAALISEKRYKEAQALAEKQPSPTCEMLVNAAKHAQEPIELIEEVMYESMLSIQPRLERFLNVIAIAAATGPLLGLLGTVTGIIKTFKLMHVFGAGDPRPLISGISEALITTELGLAMAIPALVIHALLSRKVVGIMARMEKLSVALINALSRKEQHVK